MSFAHVAAEMSSARLYIGRLSDSARDRDVERFFKGYGRIREIVLKNGYGFVVSVLLDNCGKLCKCIITATSRVI